jgi:hypothetical protein
VPSVLPMTSRRPGRSRATGTATAGSPATGSPATGSLVAGNGLARLGRVGRAPLRRSGSSPARGGWTLPRPRTGSCLGTTRCGPRTRGLRKRAWRLAGLPGLELRTWVPNLRMRRPTGREPAARRLASLRARRPRLRTRRPIALSPEVSRRLRPRRVPSGRFLRARPRLRVRPHRNRSDQDPSPPRLLHPHPRPRESGGALRTLARRPRGATASRPNPGSSRRRPGGGPG